MELKKCLVFSLMTFLFVGAAVAPADPTASHQKPIQTAEPHWSDGWYEGAEGYAEAVAEYEQTNKPMAIYMDVAWCPYCRKFEKGILSNPKVVAFMKDMIKVHVNPETSPKANMIAFQYGVRGFPSFYVHPPQSGGAVRLYTGVTPQQFIELFEQAIEL